MTATKEQLQALLERVEKATGPDREINGFIAVALRDLKPTIQPWAKENFSSWSSDSTGRVFGMHDDGSLGPNWLSDHYTASIDAALALVERMASGESTPSMVYNIDLNWHASAHSEMAYIAELFVADVDPCVMLSFHAQSHTWPLAILAALLKALISQSEEKGE